MELFIVRHGIAEPLGKGNQFSDEKRVLTNEGRTRMREIAKGFAKLGIEVDLILSSPLARAVGSRGYHAQSFADGPYPVS